jgi:hypothetical protein
MLQLLTFIMVGALFVPFAVEKVGSVFNWVRDKFSK